MVFSSMMFLWIFLPILFIGYYLLPRNGKTRNIFLLFMSLLFYAWGEPVYVCLMIASITVNYLFGRVIAEEHKCINKKIKLFLSLLFNLLLLGYFKYYSTIATEISEVLKIEFYAKNVALPIGISFYTFQIMSYVIDVYRGNVKVQKNYLDLALYVSFFPQLVAGPIVKYKDIEKQIAYRENSVPKIYTGIKRFIYGLSKKVIIANSVAQIVDSIFANPIGKLDTKIIWLGIFLYALQIYYDFSGYSDMAIGLGKMFGFDFLENFNYPYISQSVREFWRRWHISLSTWFREYVYIPLGGNRKGQVRTYINLLLVFFLTGVWHGATFNFWIWGLFHGFFLIVERAWLGNILEKNKVKILNHVYTLSVVIVGWSIFRCNSWNEALLVLKGMFVLQRSNQWTIWDFISARGWCIIIVGILFSGVIQKLPLMKRLQVIKQSQSVLWILEIPAYMILLFVCIMLLVSGTYNPFIYFRF